MAHLITQGMHRVLTPLGEDRVEVIWDELQSTPGQSEIRLPSRTTLSTSLDSIGGEDALQSSWDMGYISLRDTPRQVERHTGRLHSGRKGVLASTEMLHPGTQEYMGSIEDVQQALKREVLFRPIIRYWRIFHIVLAVVTIDLTLWHIEYALSLVLPALQKYVFGYLLPWP